MTREENIRRLEEAKAKKGFRPPNVAPILRFYEGRPDLSPRVLDIEAGNYAAGRAPIMAPPKMRSAPTIADRVAVRFAPDYSVHQYEDDVPSVSGGLPIGKVPPLELNITPEAIGDAAQAAPGAFVDVVKGVPRFLGETVPVVGQAIAEATGVPALIRDATGQAGSSNDLVNQGDIAYMMGDDSGARDAYRQAEGQRLGTAGSLALTAMGGAGLARGGGHIAEAVAQNAVKKAPSMALPTATAIGAGTAGALIASPAEAAVSPETARALAIEDRYIRETREKAGPLIPNRPDANRARSAGFGQGLLLDWDDDRKRNAERAVERDRLREEWDATPEDQRTGEQAARLFNAEYDADPVGYEAITNPEAFNDGRFRGELTTGLGTTFASTAFGALIRNQGLSNAIFGALKGGIYGAGSGEGDVPWQERAYNAGKDAVVSTAVSAAAVPTAKKVAQFANELPIFAAERGFKIPGTTGQNRFVAPSRLVLEDGLTPEKAYGYALANDAARKDGLFAPPKIAPRLDALIDRSPEGQDAQIRMARQPIVDLASDPQTMIPQQFDGPMTDAAHTVSMRLLEPGKAGIAGWQMLSDNQRRMAADALREQLMAGKITPEEQAFLRSKAGFNRMQQIELLSGAERYPGWADLIRDQPSFDNVPQVNRWWDTVTGQAVPTTRLNPDTARDLGRAKAGEYRFEVPVEGEPYSPGTFSLNDLFKKEKIPGRRPAMQPPSRGEKIADLTTKMVALAGAIPATGFIDEHLIEPIEPSLGIKFEGPKAPPLPLGADADLRRRLAADGLNAEAETTQEAFDVAGETFDAKRDAKIADAQSTLDDALATIARLERTPEELPIRDEEGNVIGARSNAVARRAALAKAKELRGQVSFLTRSIDELNASRADDKRRETSAIAGRLEGLREDQKTLQMAR